jgi:hypothetical protein
VAFVEQGSRQIGPCHGCGKYGHLVRDCPDLKDEEKKAVAQVLQNNKKNKTGQAHVDIQEKAKIADAETKELQECIARE